MGLSRIAFTNLRNISSLKLDTSARLLLFHGNNGSGKSSLLEGVYLLGRGASFRTKELDYAVSHLSDEMVCFGEAVNEDAGKSFRIGVSRQKTGKLTRVRINGESARTLSELAAALPILIVTPDTFGFINGGPGERRRFVDWGVFHVEHQFKVVWQNWRKLLLQRNKLLKSGNISRSELSAWDNQYVAYSDEISRYRDAYFAELKEILIESLKESSEQTRDIGDKLTITLSNGWYQNDVNHMDQLASSVESDVKKGFTTLGPHRADIKVKVGGVHAKEVLSRGQQKTLITHLYLSQLEILRRRTNQRPIVLIDDVGAELDTGNQVTLLTRMLEKGAQVFVTVLDKQQSEYLFGHFNQEYDTQMFHVEQGAVTKVHN
ncbi:Recombinational DNA repair ATPase (RecF pathway) [Hahella chejuensis KCTC 2396]|uniref:DNA replication and repair protein RecF n=1 Tax=Hahella chejuensis (strain KCTC 2396) TaxID=349521 RepID=RECF_HAHCH|nr:DNA replication/repair protein RecF [Hahella chejuensis]Q2SQZ4.1 RecName: Full=DNA replication and repair protein RecF [Hahella chejuensis KCTC 2396]ABC26930.1 Recombinational DNA repair ATPase (RecF pathway) [Hahella chejuensis KCTC 2396]